LAPGPAGRAVFPAGPASQAARSTEVQALSLLSRGEVRMSWTHPALAASRTARRLPAAESSAVQHVGEIGHDHIRTVLPERLGMPGAVNADHVAESAGPPHCHAGQRNPRRPRQPAVRARAPERWRGTSPGRACREDARPARMPSIRASNRSSIRAAASTSQQLALEDTTAVQARSPDSAHVADRSLICRHPALPDPAQQDHVLALLSPCTVCASGGSSWRPSGR
jgi:hypothetical protein